MSSYLHNYLSTLYFHSLNKMQQPACGYKTVYLDRAALDLGGLDQT